MKKAPKAAAPMKPATRSVNPIANTRLFVPQSTLDSWISLGEVDLESDTLHIKNPSAKLKLHEAVHVIREVTGQPDGHALIGKVKTKNQLDALNAEASYDSLILGDCAYEVVQGYVAESAEPLPAHAADLQPVRATDLDLLAQLFLEKK